MKLCLIYLHDKPLTEGVTKKHFDLLSLHNPEAAVYPVTFRLLRDYLPNDFTIPYDKEWWYCDMAMYLFFRMCSKSFDRYMLIEYDTFCNVDIAKHFIHEFSQASVVCSTPQYRDWPGYTHHIPPDEYRKDYDTFFAGATPACGIIHTHDSLKRTTDVVFSHPMFKFLPHEIRAGTAAAMAGFPLVPYLPENAINMQWSPLTPTGYGLFHPVKQ